MKIITVSNSQIVQKIAQETNSIIFCKMKPECRRKYFQIWEEERETSKQEELYGTKTCGRRNLPMGYIKATRCQWVRNKVDFLQTSLGMTARCRRVGKRAELFGAGVDVTVAAAVRRKTLEFFLSTTRSLKQDNCRNQKAVPASGEEGRVPRDWCIWDGEICCRKEDPQFLSICSRKQKKRLLNWCLPSQYTNGSAEQWAAQKFFWRFSGNIWLLSQPMNCGL